MLAATDRKDDEIATAFYAIALVRLGRVEEARKEIDTFLAAEDSEYGLQLQAEVKALLPR